MDICQSAYALSVRIALYNYKIILGVYINSAQMDI